ncbi:MAG: sigma-54 dependent transcriptional regulator [Pseudomonadota bacterium]
MSASHILVVDDESDIRSLIQEILSDEGYEVTVAADASQARAARENRDPDLVLLDIWMPDTDGITLLREWSKSSRHQCPVVMMSGHGTVDTAVEATRLGAFDFIEKPLSLAKLLRTVERALENRNNSTTGTRSLLPEVLAPVGRSPLIRALREQVRTLAAHKTPVLITGEAGTGREAFARYMHDLSPNASGEFVRIMSGALTDDNAEQLLFGTSDQEGYLARANGGTLFINELGDLGDHAQKLILSALDQGSFLPAGATQSKPIETRIIASVQPDFDALVDEGTLRRELLSMLNVLSLRVPPLREYAEDVPDLLRYYIDKLVDAESLSFRRFGVAAQNRLRNYPWPDNVRELKNLVRRLLITGDQEEISLDEIEAELDSNAHSGNTLVKQDLLSLPLREAREQFERSYLLQQLALCEGKVGKLAQRVGMERTHLYRKLRSLGIDFRQAGAASDD